MICCIYQTLPSSALFLEASVQLTTQQQTTTRPAEWAAAPAPDAAAASAAAAAAAEVWEEVFNTASWIQ